MTTIAIIGGMGSNLNSVLFALERLRLKASIQITTDPNIIKEASYVILPGVGHAQNGMQKLKEFGLINTIKQLKQPVLGICLGMQLLFEYSEEGDVDCLGIIPGITKALHPKPSICVPHTGWNLLNWHVPSHPFQHKVYPDDYFYFVHGFAVPVNEYTVASCSHGQSFSAIVAYKNYYATQFHPERSGKVGEQLLRNFCEI